VEGERLRVKGEGLNVKNEMRYEQHETERPLLLWKFEDEPSVATMKPAD
jgi:hypothetical protein